MWVWLLRTCVTVIVDTVKLEILAVIIFGKSVL